MTAALALIALGCGGGGAGGRDGGHDAPVSSPDADGGLADALDAPASDGGASCGLGGYPASACRSDNQRCGHVCGQACVDFAIDPANCGACGVTCNPQAPCRGGACQAPPTVIVSAAPGCLSIDIVHENGQLTWADLAHGTIKRVATSGGPVTTLASSLTLAGIHAWPSNDDITTPTVTPILVRDGTVYFIAAEVIAGGAGATIQSVTPGSAPRVLLPAALAPATWTTTLAYTDQLSRRPLIGAIALSPDGNLLTFAAGGSLFSIPSAGAASSADVTRLGPTLGQLSMATALVTDGRRFVFPSPFDDDWVDIYDLDAPCDATPSPWLRCPGWLSASHVDALMDTIVIRDGWLYWSNGSDLRRAEWAKLHLPPNQPTIAQTTDGDPITGFDVGSRYAYFGTFGTNGSRSDGRIERAPLDHGDAAVYGDTLVLARGQKAPSSLVADGTRAFWTTDDCDIKVLADAPP